MDGTHPILLLGALLTSAAADAEDLASSVIGTWRLVSCKVTHSVLASPLGALSMRTWGAARGGTRSCADEVATDGVVR
jgi:hypothetical protein